MLSIKQYTKDNVYIDTYTNEIISISSFQSQINGGYGNINIILNFNIENTLFEIGQIFKIYYEGNLIFTGFINSIDKVYTYNIQNINIQCLGLASLLTKFVINTSYNNIASYIAKSLIDVANLRYGMNLFSYDIASIPDTIGNINISFDYQSIFSAFEKLAEITGKYFFIDNTGKCFFNDYFSNHKLTLNDEVENLEINEDGTDLINTLYLQYNGGYKTYSDATSISTYGKREIYKSESFINDLGTADYFGNNYINDNKDKTKKINLQVNKNYYYFNIKPGDLFSLRNIKYNITDLKIMKINFNLETCYIELEKTYLLNKELGKTMQGLL